MGRWCVVLAFVLVSFVITAFSESSDTSENLEPSEPSEVFTLTEANFDELTSDGSWLIEFYAPWCSHCKKLSPIFDEAAKALKGKINLAKVDCTTEKGLSSRFSVKSYPTLKFLRSNVSRDYRDDRTQEAIIRFGRAMSQPPVTSVQVDTINKYLNIFPVTFLYFAHSNSPTQEIYEKAALIHQGRFGFLKAADSTLETGSPNPDKDKKKKKGLREKYKVSESDGATVLYLTNSVEPISLNKETRNSFFTSSAPPTNTPDGVDWSQDHLEIFIATHSLPLVSEMGPSNFEELTTTGKLLVFSVTVPSDSKSKFKSNQDEEDIVGEELENENEGVDKLAATLSKSYLKQMLELAKEYNKYLVFANIDGMKYGKYVEQFSIVKEHLPTMFIFDFPNEQFYVSENIVLRTKSQMQEFIDNVLAGKIKPKGTHSWWSPIRLYHKFEKWLGTFSETQLLVGIIMVMILFLVIFVMACVYGTSADEEIPPNSNPPVASTSPRTSSSTTTRSAAVSPTATTSQKKRTKKD